MKLKFLIILIALIGCSSKKNAPLGASTTDLKGKDVFYKIGFSNPYWENSDPKASDYVFFNKEDGSLIMISTACYQKKTKLKEVANNTFKGYPDYKKMRGEFFDFVGHNVYELEGEVTIEKKHYQFLLRNFVREPCYYDFLLLSEKNLKFWKKDLNKIMADMRFLK
jgi:hypothetical protein